MDIMFLGLMLFFLVIAGIYMGLFLLFVFGITLVAGLIYIAIIKYNEWKNEDNEIDN